MDIKQDFKVYCSTNLNEFKKSIDSDFLNEDDELILEGIASSTSMDWDGDYMTQECLEDMKSQAIGLTVLQDHGNDLKDIIGKVLEVTESSADLFKIRFSIIPSAKKFIKELLDNDINLGLSIGAKALDYEPNEDANSYGWKINKVKLFEISLVSLPANWDSYGSVEISKAFNEEDMITATCFNGACKQLVKNHQISIQKELEDTNDDEDEIVTHQDCINYVNELGISMYDRLLEQIAEEIEKIKTDIFYNMNNTNSNNSDTVKEDTNNQSTNEEDTNNSSKKEDVKEKKLDMSEIEEKIDTEVQTPTNSIEEEVNVTSVEENEFMKSMEEEVKIGKSLDTHETETVSNEEILKSIKELTSVLSAQNDNMDAKISEALEKKLEQEREVIRKEVEEELFKELTTERKPVETDQVKVEKKLEEENKEESVETKKSMNTYDIAKMLCNQ